MKTIGSYEAKTHLPRLLKEVERGETVVITRNGHSIARLIPVAMHEVRRDPRGAMKRLLASKATLGYISLQSLRDEGRKY